MVNRFSQSLDCLFSGEIYTLSPLTTMSSILSKLANMSTVVNNTNKPPVSPVHKEKAVVPASDNQKQPITPPVSTQPKPKPLYPLSIGNSSIYKKCSIHRRSKKNKYGTECAVDCVVWKKENPDLPHPSTLTRDEFLSEQRRALDSHKRSRPDDGTGDARNIRRRHSNDSDESYQETESDTEDEDYVSITATKIISPKKPVPPSSNTLTNGTVPVPSKRRPLSNDLKQQNEIGLMLVDLSTWFDDIFVIAKGMVGKYGEIKTKPGNDAYTKIMSFIDTHIKDLNRANMKCRELSDALESEKKNVEMQKEMQRAIHKQEVELRKQIEELKKKGDKIKVVDELQVEKKTLEDKIHTARKCYATLEKECTEWKKKHADSEKQLKEYMTDMTNMKKTLTDAIQQIKSKSAAIDENKQIVEELKAKRREVEGVLKHTETELSKTKDNFLNLLISAPGIPGFNGNQVISSQAQQIKALQEEVKKAINKSETLESEMARINTNIGSYWVHNMQQYDSVPLDKRHGLESSITSMLHGWNRIQDKAIKTSTELDKARSELKNANPEVAMKLKAEVAALQLTNEQLRKEKADIASERDKITKDMNEWVEVTKKMHARASSPSPVPPNLPRAVSSIK